MIQQVNPGVSKRAYVLAFLDTSKCNRETLVRGGIAAKLLRQRGIFGTAWVGRRDGFWCAACASVPSNGYVTAVSSEVKGPLEQGRTPEYILGTHLRVRREEV